MPDVIENTPPASDANLSWYRRLYLRVEALSATPHALAALLVVSFVDASFFPVPPFAVLVPMVLAKPRRWFILAMYGTIASLVGGVLGYAVGHWFGAWASHVLHIDLNAHVDRFGIHKSVGQLLGDKFWILSVLCSVLPTPFKVVAIGSGMVNVPFGKFMLAAVIGRLARFLGFAGAARFANQASRWSKA